MPRILPTTAGVATVSSLFVIAAIGPFEGLAAYASALLVALFASQGANARLAAKVMLWTLPLFLPLLLIHGVLNHSYPVDGHFFGAIPLRSAGLAFAGLLSLRMLIISIVGAYWLCVRREDLVESLLRLNLPNPIILFLVQGVSTARLVSTRIDNVYLAQRARGVPVSGSFLERLRAFPSVLIPVIIGTLVEADGRVPALVSQGFGSLPIAPAPRPRTSGWERLLLCLPAIAAMLVLVCTGTGR